MQASGFRLSGWVKPKSIKKFLVALACEREAHRRLSEHYLKVCEQPSKDLCQVQASGFRLQASGMGLFCIRFGKTGTQFEIL
jgi:hypothetical protein